MKELITTLAEWWMEKQYEQNEREATLLNQEHENNIKINQFSNIMKFADMVFDEYEESKKYSVISSEEHPILDVIRILGKKVHTDYSVNLLKQLSESDLDDITIHNSLFNKLKFTTDDGKSFFDILRKMESDKVVYLNKDVVLAWPWSKSRLSLSIARTGLGRSRGKWEQDLNHNTVLLLPVGITFVIGGNHSITAGIAHGDGVIKPIYTYDMSPLYNYISCDGAFFYSLSDNSILGSVNNFELAAIFEIGRKMMNHNISF